MHPFFSQLRRELPDGWRDLIGDLLSYYRGSMTLDNLLGMTVNDDPVTGLLWWLDRANREIEARANARRR